MSQSFIDRSQQNNTSITPDETIQKKIDLVAQRNWINNHSVDQGWGIYGDNLPANGQSQPTQMFTSDEEEQVQRKPKGDLLQGKAEDELQMKENPTGGSSGTKSSMPEGVRGKMENSFGADFSEVNIHQNSEQASNIGALAYTQGNDVHFAPGQYNPASQKGQELLGHELTHVVQQKQGRVKGTQNKGGMSINSDPALEKEAGVMGAQAAQGKMADVASKGSGVQRKESINDKTLPTTYYNLNGKEVKDVNNGKNNKVLVLITSKKESKVNEAIARGEVVNVPANEVVEKMEEAFDNTEKSEKENGFRVGKKGTISVMVEGSEGTINSSDWKPAIEDLKNKGDLVDYDIHTHPLGKDKNGEVNSIGIAEPSDTDISNVVGSQPNIVLGYKEKITQPDRNVIGGKPTVSFTRQIGFFNSNGQIGSPINFSTYKSAVKKINKQ